MRASLQNASLFRFDQLQSCEISEGKKIQVLMVLNSVITLSGLGVRELTEIAAGSIEGNSRVEVMSWNTMSLQAVLAHGCDRLTRGTSAHGTQGNAALLPRDTQPGEALHVRVLHVEVLHWAPGSWCKSTSPQQPHPQD